MNGETWAEIPGYPGYEASSEGRMRSVDRIVEGRRRGKPWSMRRPGQVLALRPDTAGYLRVQLGRGGRTELVHRLVLLAFVGPCPTGCEAAHGDGDPANNRPWNLRWATHAENIADRRVHGTALIGERNPNAKLTAEQVARIRELGAQQTQVALAGAFGVSRTRIRSILRGEAWA